MARGTMPAALTADELASDTLPVEPGAVEDPILIDPPAPTEDPMTLHGPPPQ